MTNKNIVGISVLALACGGIGYVMSIAGLHVPMWMDSALTAMPFFLTGYLLRCYSPVLYGSFSKKDILYAMFSLLLLVFVFLYDEWQGTNVIAFGENTFDIPFLSLYIGGITGTYFVLMVAKFFEKLPLISYFGRYSIVILLTHLLYLFVIRNILYQLSIEQDNLMINMIVFIIILLLELPTTSCCVKYLPFFSRRKIYGNKHKSKHVGHTIRIGMIGDSWAYLYHQCKWTHF